MMFDFYLLSTFIDYIDLNEREFRFNMYKIYQFIEWFIMGIARALLKWIPYKCFAALEKIPYFA